MRPASDRRVPEPPSSVSRSGRSATRASSLRDSRSLRRTAAVRCAEVRSASRPADHSESGWSDDVSADVERTPDATSSSENLTQTFRSRRPRIPRWVKALIGGMGLEFAARLEPPGCPIPVKDRGGVTYRFHERCVTAPHPRRHVEGTARRAVDPRSAGPDAMTSARCCPVCSEGAYRLQFVGSRH